MTTVNAEWRKGDLGKVPLRITAGVVERHSPEARCSHFSLLTSHFPSLTVIATLLMCGWVPARPANADEPAIAPPPLAPALDDAVFREGLRQRGLLDWLDQHETDTPPTDEIDAQLRRREKLLARWAAAHTPPAERRACLTEAVAILRTLIERHPDHPSHARWLIEAARDALDRRAPEAFEAVLLYEMPGRDRAAVAALSGEAVAHLEALRARVAAVWEATDAWDEEALEAAAASGALTEIEQLDRQSVYLLTWARFYHAVTARLPSEEQGQILTDLYVQVTEESGWTDPAAGDPVQRCNALLLAAIAARLTGRFDAATACAREVIVAERQTADPEQRRRLRTTGLVSVVEQIRALRDTGKLEEALQAVEQARTWAAQSRPQELPPALAIALVERGILARSSLAGAPAENLLEPPQALAPVQQLAGSSPETRDEIYHLLAGALADHPLSPDARPFALQLAAGAILADAAQTADAAQAAQDPRIARIAEVGRQLLRSPPQDLTAAQAAELAFLTARALYAAGQTIEAADTLVELATRHPQHDRARTAAEQAVAMTHELLRQTHEPPAASVWQTLVRAGRLLRETAPDSPLAEQITSRIAAALEHLGHLREAADEYGKVPATAADGPASALGKARCLNRLLHWATADGNLREQDIKTLTQETVAAAQAAAVTTLAERAPNTGAGGSGDRPEACLAAEAVLLLANVLNDPAVARPDDAVQALADFETRFAACPDAVGGCLRERVIALRQLKRLTEARKVVELFLRTDPEHAGPAIARLLEALRQEVDEAADRGDADAVRHLSEEAVVLARMLLDWSAAHPGRVLDHDLLTIRTWLGWSLLTAGRPEEGLAVFEDCRQRAAQMHGPPSAVPVEIRLGQAEALAAADRPAEALPIFTTLWHTTAEGSPAWWQAFVGSLDCHTRLGREPGELVQAIRQRRHLSPDLGSPRWRRQLEELERANLARLPATTQPE